MKRVTWGVWASLMGVAVLIVVGTWEAAEASAYAGGDYIADAIIQFTQRLEGIGRYEVVATRGITAEQDCLILLDTVTGKLERRYLKDIR